MEVKFHLFIFMSCFLLEELVQSQFIFSNCLVDTPQNCDADSLSLEWPKTKMRFLLYTRKTQNDPERLHMCNGTLPMNSHYNPDKPLVVIIPGFMFGTCEIEFIPEIKDELLEKGDMNVIVIINAEEYGNDFLTAMGKAEKSANITIQVLRNIQTKRGIKKENLYLIGHSLGAHVAGIVGQQFPVHRITGLDPAGVMYSKDTPLHKRLDPDDADVVDVIHTNGGTGLPYLGAYFQMGDADIYVNGGTVQPGCMESAWEALKHFKFLFGVGVSSVPSLCAHSKSIEYYKLSFNNEQGKFTAYPCNSYKKFKTGNCTGEDASSVTLGFDFENTFTEEQKAKKFPRKYYVDTE